MAKFFTFFAIALVLGFALSSSAARRDPAFAFNPVTQEANLEAQKAVEAEGAGCEGFGKQDCSIKRALADAHLDYIYTQGTEN